MYNGFAQECFHYLICSELNEEEKKDFDKKKVVIDKLILNILGVENMNGYEDLSIHALMRHVIFTNEEKDSKLTAYSWKKYENKPILDSNDEGKYFDEYKQHSLISNKNLHKPLLWYLIYEAIPDTCKKYNISNEKKIELVIDALISIVEIHDILPNGYKIELEEITKKAPGDVTITNFFKNNINIEEELKFRSMNAELDMVDKKKKKTKKKNCIIV